MKKIFFTILIFLFSVSLYSQNNFTRVNTKFSGKDAWKDWWVDVNGTSGSLKTVFTGDDAWTNWDVNLQNYYGTIRTVW